MLASARTWRKNMPRAVMRVRVAALACKWSQHIPSATIRTKLMTKAIITPNTLPIPFYTAKIIQSTTIRTKLMTKAIITPNTLPIPLYTANMMPPPLSTMGKSAFSRLPCWSLGVVGIFISISMAGLAGTAINCISEEEEAKLPCETHAARNCISTTFVTRHVEVRFI